MPPGVDEKPYASCEIIQKPRSTNWPEEAIRRINDKYDNYKYHTGSSSTGSESVSGSSVDTSDLTEDERQKIDICFRGLKTQVRMLFFYSLRLKTSLFFFVLR